jgi:hypothetical protein
MAATSTTGGASVSAAVSASFVAPPTPDELASRHAPLYRFNAWVAGINSIANRNEDYFPMSVTSYLDQLAAGSVRVVTHEASGATVTVSEMRPLSTKPVIAADKIEGAPWGPVGDVPGTAPVYFHAYEDTKARVRHPDGSGSATWFIEYWLFYGQDVSREKLPFGPVLDISGHKGDLEHTRFAIQVDLGPGGSFLCSKIVRGYFAAHSWVYLVEPADMELVDDQGQPDPRGGHPVSYVSVGKHAEYPQAGYWIDNLGLLPFVTHDEIFLGNGVEWTSWRSPLVDLDANNGSPEFAPASFALLLDPSLKGMTDWRDYKGTWGDTRPPSLGFLNPLVALAPFGDSPKGPTHQSDYGKGPRYTKKWADVKRTATRLTLTSYAPVVPAPLPVRK